MASFEHAVTSSLQCPICLELLGDPKQLSCTHTFCKTCLNNLLTSKGATKPISCPICRSETNVKGGDVSYLQTNVPLKSLIEQVKSSGQLCELCETKSKAIKYCCDCEKNLCSSCHEDHDKWKPNISHKVVGVDDIRQGKVVLKKKVSCQEHKPGEEQVCTDVCIDCKKNICLRCRMLYHAPKNHNVQDAAEYNASKTAQVNTLQKEGESKVKVTKDHIGFVEKQVKIVIAHIDKHNDEIDRIHKESVERLNKRKAALKNQSESLKQRLCQQLAIMKSVDERSVASIESASELAVNSLKAPLEGDIIAIRDSLCSDLQTVLSKGDPDNSEAADVSRRAETLELIQNRGRNELEIGELQFVEWKPKKDIELPVKNSMECMAATPDGKMAVGCGKAKGILLFTADGQLLQSVMKDGKIRGVGFLSDGRYVVCGTNNSISLYTPECKQLDVRFDTLSYDEGGFADITVDSDDHIYVSYRKTKKIQVFTSAGGKAIREILCVGYAPQQIFVMKSSKMLVVKSGNNTVRVIDESGAVQHDVTKHVDIYAHPAVCQDGSIIVAWVKIKEGRVSIDQYTRELKHAKTLITDQEIFIPERAWCYLQEFSSGDIAFCTADTLYIFRKSVTNA